MRTYKEKCIKAIEIIMKERLTDRKEISCPLCKLYGCLTGCVSCPSKSLENIDSFGCKKSHSFVGKYVSSYSDMEIKARLKYWQKRLPLLKKVPAKYFTPSGFTKKAFYNIMKDD